MSDWMNTDPLVLARDEYQRHLARGGLPLDLPDTETREWMQREIGSRLAHSPLSRRYVSRIHAMGAEGSRIYTAGQVLGERDFRVGGFLLLPEDMWAPGSIPREMIFPFAINAKIADPYLWTDRCFREARETGVPRHVLSRSVLPRPRMWWTFETAYDYFDPTGKRDSLSIDGFLLTDDIDGFAVQMFGADKDGRPGIWAFGYEYGMRFPDDLPEDMPQAPSQQLLSLLAFLNSPYIPKRHERPTRAERREQQRESEPTDEQVTFIDLRTTPTTTTTESDGTTTEVGWKHRWIVRGHNRAQWYPSEQAHHLIYIAPYMKGPEDAPLLEHVYRVKR